MPIGIENLLLSPTAPLRKAAETIELNVAKIALVADGDRRLLGTVTDGDIRRGLLRGCSLDTPVSQVMNHRPHTARRGMPRRRIYEMMRQLELRQIPIVDRDGRVIEIEVLQPYLQREPLDNMVVVMAGGEGRRLLPLTESIPKPMLPVGGRPILETVVANFARQGLTNLILSVNYRAEVIKAHFRNGADHDVRIRYIEETEPLGTAGSLRLLPERPTAPLIVVNGDVLTTLNYLEMLNFHQDTGAGITIGIHHYQNHVPFGVVRLDGERVCEIQEKPVFDYFISSGIYVIGPEILELVRPAGPDDMPQLVSRVIGHGGKVTGFPIREYWVDVGRISDLERAQVEYADIFGG